MRKLFVLLVLAGSVGGCASKAENITAAYVSPMMYASLNCEQLREEATRVSVRAAQAAGVQDSKASNDAIATGVGVVLFWPALLFIKGDSATAAELARLKGEMEAIEQASTQKSCGIIFQREGTPTVGGIAPEPETLTRQKPPRRVGKAVYNAPAAR